MVKQYYIMLVAIVIRMLFKYLITELDCDPSLPDNDGNMPIHDCLSVVGN